MSEKKLTPAEAWEHVRVLWPDAYALNKDTYGNSTLHRTDKQCLHLGKCIDWPPGVDRWPPAEKPRRPAKMPEDWGKPAWFWDDASDEKAKGGLCGLTKTHFEHWIDEGGIQWLYAEVECDHESCPQLANRQPHCPLDRDSSNPVQPEPEWITPTEEHIGQAVQVRNGDEWMHIRVLTRIDQGTEHPFFTEEAYGWRYARIRNPKYVAPVSLHEVAAYMEGRGMVSYDHHKSTQETVAETGVPAKWDDVGGRYVVRGR